MAENSENMDIAENSQNTETAEGAQPAGVAEPGEDAQPAEMAAEPTPEPERLTPEPLLAAVEADEPSAPARPKRRIRTRSLFAAAVALGVVGGAAAGYTIQALRKPTPLPPLAVAQPVYPRSPIYDGTRPPALPASQDDATIVNGDLTKLLLPTPAGATAAFYDHEWMELSADAADCASCFADNLSGRLVRIAATNWNRKDGLFVEIRIYQYRPGSSGQVATALAQARSRPNALALPEGISAAGSQSVDAGGDDEDFAIAAHGDLAVYFWVTASGHAPDPSIINDLIKQQMARL